MAEDLTKYPVGQQSSFVNDNPVPQTGVKEARKTAVNPQATTVVRQKQYGKPDSMKP